MAQETNKMRAYARQRARMATARMLRLLELDAPALIIMRELLLLEDRLRLLDPAAYGDARRDQGLADIKRRAGFCTEDECTEPRGATGDVCDGCAAKTAAEVDEDDDDDSAPEAS